MPGPQKNALMEIKGEQVVFSLMSRRTINKEEEEKDSLEEPRGVLSEFSNLMLNELPQDLPFIKEIQYQIDLVFYSSLPNKVAYRLALKKSKSCRHMWWSC
jgi:hypothetical protein